MKKNNIQKIILENKSLGFDELALLSNCTKEEVKKEWNKAGLGWKLMPKTLISFKRLSHNQYELLSDVVVFIAPALPIIASKGTVTDFASVPRLFHFFMDKDDNSIAIPAIAHDVLYASEFVDRKVADTILMALMKHAGAPFITRYLVYLAVRVGGKFVWLKHNKEQVKENSKKLLLAIEKYDKHSHFRYNATNI